MERAVEAAGVPNTFTSTQHDGTMGLDYSRLVTVLWSKVKQLEARLMVLEAAAAKRKR